MRVVRQGLLSYPKGITLSRTDEALNPETFDIDAWLTDAHLPEESVRIYKRADLLGRITALQEKIKHEAEAEGADSLTGTIELQKAREEYDGLLETFGASALTVYVATVPSSKVREIRKVVDAEQDEKVEAGLGKSDATEWRAAELLYRIMAASILAVSGPDGERTPVEWDAEQVKALENHIGTGQFDALMEAKKRADSKVQEPDADFLRNVFGTSRDDTED